MGFARPIAKGDERVVALEKYSLELGIIEGEHLRLAHEIDHLMSERYRENINVGGYTSAVLSDCGFSPYEIYQLATLLIAGGVMACHADTFDRPPESFFPLHCNDIDYQGPPPRPVPDRA